MVTVVTVMQIVADRRHPINLGVAEGRTWDLYTTDAADERTRGDVGGRRRMKKKKEEIIIKMEEDKKK